MAIVDVYADSNIQGNKVNKLTTNASQANAGSYHGIHKLFIGTTDNSGSFYRLIKSANPNLVPRSFDIFNDAIAGATSFDIILCAPDQGAALALPNTIPLCTAQSLATQRGYGTQLTGLSNIPVNRIGQRLFELAGHDATNKLEAYDVVLRVNTQSGTAGGNVAAHSTWIIG